MTTTLPRNPSRASRPTGYSLRKRLPTALVPHSISPILLTAKNLVQRPCRPVNVGSLTIGNLAGPPVRRLTMKSRTHSDYDFGLHRIPASLRHSL